MTDTREGSTVSTVDNTTPAGAGGPSTIVFKGASLISADREIGVRERADIEVVDGTISRVEEHIDASVADEVVDASGMIAMPGFVETHWHMWSSLGKNFLDEGYEYFDAKSDTALAYEPEDYYNSVLLGLVEAANSGITTVHNWDHNTRSPEYADAQMRAHVDSLVRARYAYGNPDGAAADTPIDYADLDRLAADWFGSVPNRRDHLTHLGVNVRWTGDVDTFAHDVREARRRGIPMAMHNGQTRPPTVGARELEERGFLDKDLMLCHGLGFSEEDRIAAAAAGASVSLSPHSEMRLGSKGTYHEQLMRMDAAGINIALSLDATSLGPVNFFEAMSVTWNFGVPWEEDPLSEELTKLTFEKVIEMATINGARALGIDDITGSITPGKRADLILIRKHDLNIAPVVNIPGSIVRSATPANVDSVMIDGRFLKRRGQMLMHDVPRVIANAEASARAVASRAKGDRLSGS